MSDDEDLEIRHVNAEDLLELGQVLGVPHAHFYRARLSQRGVVLSAWRKGELAGAILVSWEPPDEPELRQHLPGVPMLYRLQVHAEMRRRGVATALVRAAEELLIGRGHRAVASGVDPANKPAVLLYQSLGFRRWNHGEIATVRELYDDDGRLVIKPDRCLIFVRRLTASRG